MAGRSVMSRIWNNFKQSLVVMRTKDRFVGVDQYGNKYFQRPPDLAKGIKEQRRLEPVDPRQQMPEIPVEWMTWLQGRRRDPPTDEEIEKNLHSSLKIQARVKELEHKHAAVSETESSSSRLPKGRFPTYEDYEKHPGELEGKDDRQR